MKTKILLFPLLLLIIIVTIVWFIVPAWKEVQAQRTALSEKEILLEKMQGKNQTATTLKGELEKMSEDKDLVYSYVPQKINDEEIMNSFVGYANMQGGGNVLRIANFSVQKIKDAQTMNIPDMGGGDLKNLSLQAQEVKPTSIKVTMGMAGSYEGIKEFFSKMAKLKRSFDFEKVIITRETQGTALLSNTELSFNYLSPYNPGEVAESLLAESFDQSTLKIIRDSANTEIMKVEASLQGRPNPFLP